MQLRVWMLLSLITAACGPDVGASRDAGPTGDGSSSDTGADCPATCSADLRQVLDCHGAVLSTCADNEGCSDGGVCADPCASAAASKSSLGCDFFTLVPPPEPSTRGSCFAVLLTNTWPVPITLDVAYQGQSLAIGGMVRRPVGSGAGLSYEPLTNGQLGAGEVAVVFLAQSASGGIHHLTCPAGVTPGVTLDTAITGTGLGNAFRITTSAPIAAYSMYPYGGAQSYVSSASLLLPTTTWGKTYVGVEAFPQAPSISSVSVPSLQLVAAEDATTITIVPTAAIAGGPGVSAAAAGQATSVTLNRGQVLQYAQAAELSGSVIEADKPVGTWGGTSCMNIPVTNGACDSGQQQLAPTSALGHEFVAARYREREAGHDEVVPWTLVGAVDGTQLTYEPAAPAGAPLTLARGEVRRFDAAGPFVVRSQDADHPFSFAGHMSGWTNLPSSNMGDPEFVTVVPAAQYLSRYQFLTDPTYGNANLVFVRKKSAVGVFEDVTLDCVGTLGGWMAIGSSGQFEYTRVDLVVNGVAQGSCNNGVHLATSNAPFGLTVWGWDFAVSYAYPGGMLMRPINNVIF
jgi:hypothetical protein